MKKIMILVSGLIVMLIVIVSVLLILSKNTPKEISTPISIPISTPVSTAVEFEQLNFVSNPFDIDVKVPVGYIFDHISSNNDGMSELKVDGVNYSGFTGLDIYDSNRNIAFAIHGVSGVGGSNISECFKFDDTPQSFVDSTNTIKDNKILKYSEFTLFGETLRITETNQLIIKTDQFPQYNNIFCKPTFYSFKDLKITEANEASGMSFIDNPSLYRIEVSKTVDYTILAKMLSTMRFHFKTVN